MNKKNILLVAVIILSSVLGVNSVNAQALAYTENNITTDAVSVNLIFKPIQSIQVNPHTTHTTVNFEYDSPTDYSAGTIDNKTQILEDHLTVYHSGGFKVSVTSTGFKKGVDGAVIQGDHVKVTASKGTTIPSERTNFYFNTTPSLSAGTKDFFTSTGGGMGLTFNVAYEHNGWKNENTYIDFTNGTETSTYTAEVTYTITAS